MVGGLGLGLQHKALEAEHSFLIWMQGNVDVITGQNFEEPSWVLGSRNVDRERCHEAMQTS